MSPCSPSDTTINIGPSPSIGIPGFPTLPISAVQLPIKGVDLPNIGSVLDLINEFTANFGSYSFKPNLDEGVNSVLSALMNIFNQIAPFLALYNFIQPVLNIIVCICEILCALLNPFKLYRAMRKLFKQCIPNLIRMLPFMALLAMILSVLLLILALVEYIIAMVENLIKDLIANIKTLANGLSLQDDDAVSATARKIAQLLCLMENLFAVFVALGAIISVIQSLANIGGRAPCGGGSSPSIDSESCCSSDVCPPYIADNPDGIVGISGELIYYNRIDTDVRGIFGSLTPQQASSFNLPAIRGESWQFINQETNQPYPFSDIITAIGDGDQFFPEGVTFNKNTKPTKAPYTLDLTFNEFDPGVFNLSDHGHSRNFIIRNVIITQKPYIGVVDFDNRLNTALNSTGTFTLAGGLVYEKTSDLSSDFPYIINGVQATIENFIHNDPKFGYLPSVDDGYILGDVGFTLNINHEVLVGYSLITLGCIPEIATERFIANTRIESVGFDAIAIKLPPVGPNGILPDVLGAQQCTINAIAKLRQSVSPATVAVFQAEIEACLNQLKSETLESYCNILRAGVSIYESTIETNTDVEFITRKIIASVQLLDTNGTIISTNIPSTCVPLMESLLKGKITLGSISDFKYDGYSTFNANIESKISGKGILNVTFDSNTFKEILNADDNNVTTVMQDRTLNYQFVNANVISKTVADYEEQVRRDESDVASEDG